MPSIIFFNRIHDAIFASQGEDPQFFSIEKHPELSPLASKDENANKITLFQLGTEHTGTKCITFNV